MSKIFEALRKTEGGAANIAMSVLGEEPFPIAEPMVTPPQDAIEAEAPTHVPPPGQATPVSETRVEAIRIAAASPLLPFDGSDAGAAEQYKIMRTKLFHHPEQPRMLLVSSPMAGDGKTITAANLAGALALLADLRVLLIDCDFRHSSLTKLLGFSSTTGLSEILRGEATLESSLISVEQFPNLYFLPSGSAVLNPSELLSTAKWQALLEVFRREFRFTVFDAPPIGMVADYEQLQLACDGVVLVARPDHTNRRLWRKAVEIVPKSKQLGVILNCVEDWFLWKTNSYYHYHSGKPQ